MKPLLAALALALVVLAPCASAQDSSPEHLQAARDLLDEMDVETILNESVDVAIDAQLQQNPNLEPFEDVFRMFMTKYMSWQAMEAPLVQLYAEAYTEAELQEITAFYQTETGRKVARLTPTLMGRGMEMGRQAVQEHLPELEHLIEVRVQELQEAEESGGSY